MKRKILKIVLIVIASLLSLAILAGAFVFAMITPNNETISAAADTEDNVSVYSAAEPPVLSVDYLFGGLYYIDFPLVDIYGPEIFSEYTTTFNLSIMIGSTLFTSITFTTRSTNDKRLAIISGKDINGSTQRIFLRGEWRSDVSHYWCLSPNNYAGDIFGIYATEFAKFFYTCATPCLASQNYNKLYDYAFAGGYADGYTNGFHAGGYDTGFSEGYDEGYYDGHIAGVSKGHSDQITNPIIAFIEPVHSFMNTPFFGTLTYATIFNVVLFVAVAIIFIKMFSGG